MTIKFIAVRGLCTWAVALFLSQTALAAPPIEHWTQPSGAGVWLVQSPSIPMVDVQIDFDAGSRRDPVAQAGLASVASAMLDKGVRARDAEPALDENELGEAWADLGASFGVSASDDRASVSLRSLTEPKLLARALHLAARQLGEPAFPDAVWTRERQRLDAALKEARTRPGNVAALAYNHAVYGSHPYGQETTEATLAAIGTDDLRAWHAQLRPCAARVSIVGAVTRAQADDIARQLLARLPAASGACPTPAPLPEVAPLAAPVERLLPFASAQAHVFIGQPATKRDDPRFFALLVGNHILGGSGLVSRLAEQVREKRGLSYSVWSGLAPGRHAGAFTIGLQTRPDQAAQAVQVARETLARFVHDGPTEAELRAAKANLIGGFALRIDSNRKLLGNVANIAWNDLPLDYLDGWTKRVEAVSAADIRRAFGQVLQPDRMVTVVVGGAPTAAPSAGTPPAPAPTP